jgi:hypothetical protein
MVRRFVHFGVLFIEEYGTGMARKLFSVTGIVFPVREIR